MNKDTTNKMCVVKNYHTLINKQTGYANIVRVGLLLLFPIFSLGIERKLETGCGTASYIAVPNRQVVDLPIMRGNRAQKPTDFWTYFSRTMSGFIHDFSFWTFAETSPKAVGAVRTEKSRIILGVRPRGLPLFMFISPLGEKKFIKSYSYEFTKNIYFARYATW